MSIIRIDPDTMIVRANQYRVEAQNVGQIIANLDQLLSALQTEWEGDASRAYADQYFSELKPTFQRAQQLIDEVSIALERTAQQMRDSDMTSASQFK